MLNLFIVVFMITHSQIFGYVFWEQRLCSSSPIPLITTCNEEPAPRRNTQNQGFPQVLLARVMFALFYFKKLISSTQVHHMCNDIKKCGCLLRVQVSNIGVLLIEEQLSYLCDGHHGIAEQDTARR